MTLRITGIRKMRPSRHRPPLRGDQLALPLEPVLEVPAFLPTPRRRAARAMLAEAAARIRNLERSRSPSDPPRRHACGASRRAPPGEASPSAPGGAARKAAS